MTGISPNHRWGLSLPSMLVMEIFLKLSWSKIAPDLDPGHIDDARPEIQSFHRMQSNHVSFRIEHQRNEPVLSDRKLFLEKFPPRERPPF